MASTLLIAAGIGAILLFVGVAIFARVNRRVGAVLALVGLVAEIGAVLYYGFKFPGNVVGGPFTLVAIIVILILFVFGEHIVPALKRIIPV